MRVSRLRTLPGEAQLRSAKTDVD